MYINTPSVHNKYIILLLLLLLHLLISIVYHVVPLGRPEQKSNILTPVFPIISIIMLIYKPI